MNSGTLNHYSLLMFFHAAQYIQYIWQSEAHNQIVVTGIQRSIHAELKDGPNYNIQGCLLVIAHSNSI